MTLDAHIPEGPIEDKWDRHRFETKLVNPSNKRRFEEFLKTRRSEDQ